MSWKAWVLAVLLTVTLLIWRAADYHKVIIFGTVTTLERWDCQPLKVDGKSGCKSVYVPGTVKLSDGTYRKLPPDIKVEPVCVKSSIPRDTESQVMNSWGQTTWISCSYSEPRVGTPVLVKVNVIYGKVFNVVDISGI